MLIKLLTPEINLKRSMVATSSVGFEVHGEMNNCTNIMVEHISGGDNVVIQGQTIKVSYAAQNVQNESENEEKKNNEPIRETEQRSVNNNLIEKLEDLNISGSTDNDKQGESSSATNKSTVTEETKENGCSIKKTVQEVTSKKDDKSQDKNNDDDKDVKDSVNKNCEEDPQKHDPKQTNHKLNIPLDEVVDGIDNLRLTTKTEENDDDDDVISRGPIRGNKNFNIHQEPTGPYSRYTSHGLQTGGCIIAQIPATQLYDVQLPTLKPQQQQQQQQQQQHHSTIERPDSPILKEKYYLSDEAERQLLWDLIESACNVQEREEIKTHQPIAEQQVPVGNCVFPSPENPLYGYVDKSNNVSDSKYNFLCPSPSLSEDASMFSPTPQYRQNSYSSSTGTPSPLSSTDISSNCNSPSSSNSPDSFDDGSEKVFSLTFPSLPARFTDFQESFICSPQNNQIENGAEKEISLTFPSFPAFTDTQDSFICSPESNSGETITWPNKTMTVIHSATNVQPQAAAVESNTRIANINDEVVRQSVTTLNLPVIRQEPEVPMIESRKAIDRMELDAGKKMKAFHDLAMKSDEELSASDNDGDTMLLIMIAQKLRVGPEFLYALVKRLANIPGSLAARNLQNHSALLLSCMYMPDQPLVARFIAETLQSIHHDLNEVYDNGNTIIHWLCERGDTYLNVLVELLSMRDEAGNPSFDINRHNHSTGTPLLVAVKAHDQHSLNCSGIIAFLLSLGANITETERCGGRTPLHIAIKESGDPLIVQILLKAADRQGKNLVNCMDYPRDTALHYAHLRNDIPLNQQLRIITLLLQYGANNITGSQGKMPLALVMPPERKEIIRASTQRRNRKP